MGKVSNIMNGIKNYLNIWLEPEKKLSLEDAIKKYHIPPEAADELLRTANGLKPSKWFREDDEEEKPTRKSNKVRENVKQVYREDNKIQKQIEQESNNLERE